MTNRLIGCLALSFALCSGVGFSQACYAAEMSSSLSKLEDKYFQHDFSKEETPERLDRLEKLIMGEARTGSNDERLTTLLGLVPDLNAPPATSETAPTPSPDRPSPAPTPASRKPDKAMTPISDAKETADSIPNDSSYPAVTAMEKKLLGRDYIGESVGKRLDRLEIKAFGKTTASDDLQDRVDRLKSSTGIDVARMKPAGSEWADEDEDPNGGVLPFTGIAGDDPSAQAQRNFRKQQALNSFNRPRGGSDPYAGTGTYGSGGGSLPSSGAGNYMSGTYGSGTGVGTFRPDEQMPPSAPEYSSRPAGGGSAPAPQMGVSQQIALLEREVFNKTFEKDKQETILTRLNRLETNVFPQDKPAAGSSLPQRMSRLLAAVPLSQSMPDPAPQRKRKDPDFPDLDFPGPGPLSQQMPQPAPQRSGGGLSKIINGLGNALGGGYSGSYPVTPGNLVTDPSTGLLLDQYTGTLIDPMTGAVVTRRSVNNMGGSYGYPSYGGFNNGLSPMSPFGGMGSGMNFGFGGGGMRFGGF